MSWDVKHENCWQEKKKVGGKSKSSRKERERKSLENVINIWEFTIEKKEVRNFERGRGRERIIN